MVKLLTSSVLKLSILYIFIHREGSHMPYEDCAFAYFLNEILVLFQGTDIVSSGKNISGCIILFTIYKLVFVGVLTMF